MNVDVGAGTKCKQGYVGLDKFKYEGIKFVCDLNKDKLPFKNNSVDNFYCSNVLEHLDNPEETIREMYRCLKPFGRLEIKVPYWTHPNAVGPGHKNYWNFSQVSTFDSKFPNVADMKWRVVGFDWDCKVSNPLMRIVYVPIEFVIKKKRIFYETYLSHVFPIGEITFVVVKE